MDQETYEVWTEGRASITETVEHAVQLLRDQVTVEPAMDRLNRYAFTIGVLTANVSEDLKADLLALIRGGEVR